MNSSQSKNGTFNQILNAEALRGILLLSLAYYLAGLVGIQLQSTQAGITPFWPASGIAIGAFILFGIHLWPAIFIAMFFLALTMGVPTWTVILTGTGNLLEAVVPLLIARHYGFSGSLHSIRHLLILFSLALFGPLISASIGVATLNLMSDNLPVHPGNLFLAWWLGSSLGIMLFCPATLLLFDCLKKVDKSSINNIWLAVIGTASIIISMGAFHDVGSLQSPLMLNLLIPVVIISSIYFSFLGTLLPVIIACSIMVFMSDSFPPEALNLQEPSILYLDIVGLWIITFTGLILSSAHQESVKHTKLSWLSTHDGLTSLKNRHFLETKLERLLMGLRQHDMTFSLLFMDLNNFKQVNDTVGHLAGDDCLIYVSKVLTESTRTSDIVCRWGGDEFIILLPQCPTETANTIANTINDNIRSKPFVHKNEAFNLSFSIGLARAEVGESPAQLIDRADKASYHSKKTGEDITISEGVDFSTG